MSTNQDEVYSMRRTKILGLLLLGLIVVVGLMQYGFVRQALARRGLRLNAERAHVVAVGQRTRPPQMGSSDGTIRVQATEIPQAAVGLNWNVDNSNIIGSAVEPQRNQPVAPITGFTLPATDRVVVQRPRRVFETVEDPDGTVRLQQRVVFEEEIVERQNVESAKLSGRMQELLSVLRAQPADRRSEQMMEELRNLVADQFEQRHKSQLKRLNKVLQDAKNTQASLEKRAEHKGEIVERRILELLGASDPLNWNYEPINEQLPSLAEQQRPSAGRAGTQSRPSYGEHTFDQTSENRAPRFRRDTRSQQGQNAPISNAPRFEPARSFSNDEPVSGWAQVRPNADSTSQPLSEPLRAKGEEPRWSDNSRLSNSEPTRNLPVNPAQEAVLTRQQTTVSVNTTDIISIGYRLRGLQDKFNRIDELFAQGAVATSEHAETKNSLEEARAHWDFKREELAGQVKVAKLAVEIADKELMLAKRSLQTAHRLAERGLAETSANAERALLEAQKEMSLREFELKKLLTQIDWAAKFERQITGPDEADGELSTETAFETATEEFELPTIEEDTADSRDDPAVFDEVGELAFDGDDAVDELSPPQINEYVEQTDLDVILDGRVDDSLEGKLDLPLTETEEELPELDEASKN